MLKISINYNLKDPVYKQIYNQIIEAIASDNIKKGDKLPSSREMADILDINFHTVNQAYQLLRENGIIILSKNKRYMVSNENKKNDVSYEFKKKENEIINEYKVKGLTDENIIKTVKNILNSKNGGCV